MSLLRAVPLLVLAASPAAAETTTAEAALRRYGEQFQIGAIDCPRGEDIVVCGWHKKELKAAPYVSEPGDRVRLLPGEAPGGGFAPLCTWNCVEPPKGGIRNIIKGVGHLLGRDD
jgi:hypothetical protein